MPCGTMDFDEEAGEGITPDCPNCGFPMVLLSNKWHCEQCGYRDS